MSNVAHSTRSRTDPPRPLTEMDALREQLAQALQSIEALQLQVNRVDNREVPNPDPNADARHAVRRADDAWMRATKLARVERFGGSRDRVFAFCCSISDLLDPHNQTHTHDGLVYAVGHLTGDALIWYEAERETRRGTPSALDSWARLRAAILAEFQSVTRSRDARMSLRLLRQTGTVLEYNSAFRRLAVQLPHYSDDEAQFDYLHGLSSQLQRDMAKLECHTVQDLQRSALQMASRLPPVDTAPMYAAMPTASSPGTCWNCNRTGHFANRCPHPMVERHPRAFSPHRQSARPPSPYRSGRSPSPVRAGGNPQHRVRFSSPSSRPRRFNAIAVDGDTHADDYTPDRDFRQFDDISAAQQGNHRA